MPRPDAGADRRHALESLCSALVHLILGRPEPTTGLETKTATTHRGSRPRIGDSSSTHVRHCELHARTGVIPRPARRLLPRHILGRTLLHRAQLVPECAEGD